MASYTKISNDDALEILKLYGLSDIKIIETTGHGISNTNYSIETLSGTKLILKISNDKDKSQLEEEIKILRILKNNGYPLSLLPIKNTLNEYVYTYKDYTGVIFPFSEGEVQKISERTCFHVGAALGKLHSLNNYDRNVIRSFEKVGFGYSQIKSYTEQADCQIYFKEKFNEFNEYLSPYECENKLIHADLYYDNLLIKDDTIVSVLDFEQSGIGPYLLDIGISISGSCLDSNNQIDPNLISHLIRGYEQEKLIPKKDKEQLKNFVILGLFSISLWRIQRFINRNIDPSKKDSYKELLDRAITFSQIELNYE